MKGGRGMTVGDMLGGGARLVRTQPKALVPWALLYLVVVAAAAVVLDAVERASA